MAYPQPWIFSLVGYHSLDSTLQQLLLITTSFLHLETFRVLLLLLLLELSPILVLILILLEALIL